LAFFSVHVPLLLLSEVGRAETLLIALILGLLVMLLEAIAWRGLDNLFIPLGGYLLLRTHLEMDVVALLTRLGITIVLVVLTLTWRKRTTLNDSAVLGATLVGYLSWSIGGWRWLLPPLIVFLCYPLLMRRIDPELPAIDRQKMPWLPPAETYGWVRVHNIYAVLSVAAAGLALAVSVRHHGAIDADLSLHDRVLSQPCHDRRRRIATDQLLAGRSDGTNAPLHRQRLATTVCTAAGDRWCFHCFLRLRRGGTVWYSPGCDRLLPDAASITAAPDRCAELALSGDIGGDRILPRLAVAGFAYLTNSATGM
jgi:hypothetical protein